MADSGATFFPTQAWGLHLLTRSGLDRGKGPDGLGTLCGSILSCFAFGLGSFAVPKPPRGKSVRYTAQTSSGSWRKFFKSNHYAKCQTLVARLNLQKRQVQVQLHPQP